MFEAVVVDGKLPRYTDNSITDLNVYLDNLRQIREEGISENFEEYTYGIAGLGCPIFNSRGEIVLILRRVAERRQRDYPSDIQLLVEPDIILLNKKGTSDNGLQ